MNKAEKEAITSYLIPFLNLEKHFPLLPEAKKPASQAALMGIAENELNDRRNELLEMVRQTAMDLLQEDEVTDCLPKLPFKPDDTLLVFGDSTADDLQGWFSILSRVLDIGTENAEFTFVNCGLSYQTTTEALRRIQRDLLDRKPDWVFISLGLFDALRMKALPDRTLVPLSETWENLNAIESVVRSLTHHPPVWLVPHPVLPELQKESDFFDFIIDPKDLSQIQQLIAGKTGYIIDPMAKRFGTPPEQWYYLSDGIHASISGQRSTAKEVLLSLAGVKRD